ncbi:acyltransferase family protein [Scleromatobacter humisilvae]|uniref:Acyltransferase n=1 Tax=Scleromatobacter humisilvae TaxID=2897159 RepID=A0A9X2BZY8_9BURK|nr:acyltransferase [Scleromatobacter humisilvae]MCK9685891.1 acyltransferase [Scleromatobacter humisilvae]
MGATIARDARDLTPHEKAETYFPWFDWLRAACACAVMWYHGHIFAWDHAGNFAVQIFFALSGWLIGGILLVTAPSSLPRFYFNRAVRIWAPYYLAAAILLTLSVMREPITAKWIEIVIYKLTFVYNLFGVPQLAQFHEAMPQKGTLSHFWSVNVEEQFYLAAPMLLVLLGRPFGRLPWLWALLALFGLTTNLGAILLGVFAATTVHRYGDLHRKPAIRAALAAGLVVAVVLLAVDFRYDIVAPFAGLFIVLLLATPGRRTKLGTLFGGMSYPLYLNHWIGIFASNFLLARLHVSESLMLDAVVQAAIDLPLAMALYWYVDRPLLSHRAGWYTPRRGVAVTIVAYLIIAIGLAYGFAMLGKLHRAEPTATQVSVPAR